MIVLISAFIPKNVNINFLKNLSRQEKNMNVTLDSELYIQILKLYYQFEYGKSNKSNCLSNYIYAPTPTPVGCTFKTTSAYLLFYAFISF